ncbi:MAG: HRDC domain-containing protein, partial [Thiobacillaceae bacterium]
VRALGHQRLSVFGIGGELDERRWRGLLRQLLLRGHLATDHAAHGGLRLTAAARPLLRGEETFMMRVAAERPQRPKQARRTPAGPVSGAEALFERLRAWRRQLAADKGVPAYVILHDSTLKAIAAARPANLEALSAIPGIGARKLEAYGTAILRVLDEFQPTYP